MNRSNFSAWDSVFPDPAQGEKLFSPIAEPVFDYLSLRGASFFTDLAEGTGLLRSQVEDALAELVSAGLVTADGFTGLRALLVPATKRTNASRRRKNAVVYEMANAGRWSLLSRSGGTLKGNRGRFEPEVVERIARVLLRRYGVVFKRLLERESLILPWRDLLRVYHRLEARGEIRGGRFVAGFSGEQFALPEAIGQLRAVRRAPSEGEMISISGADPLNLVGIITPGNRVTAFAANRVLYRDGLPIATLESGEVSFLVEMDRAAEWRAKNVLVRKSPPPQVRTYISRTA